MPDHQRTRPNYRSTTWKLAYAFAGLFTVSVSLLLGFIFLLTSEFTASQIRDTINADANTMAERYRLQGVRGLQELMQRRQRQVSTGSEIYLLVDPRGRPLAGNLDRWPLQADRNIATGSADEEIFEIELGQYGENQHEGQLKLHQAWVKQYRLLQGFKLLVGRDVHDFQLYRARLIRVLIWGLAFTLVLALFGGWVLARVVSKRLNRVNVASRAIMAGDLSQRIERNNSGDEFDELAANLNAMLDRIEAALDDVKRVADNIAHDLRTPLARLRTQLEGLLLDGLQEGQEQAVADAISNADQLLSTFNALQRIARIESDQRRAGFRSFDLSSLCEDVVELYQPILEEQGLALAASIDAGLSCAGDRDLLFQAVANILDNASKYAKAATQPGVVFMLKQHREHISIQVSDHGPGIPDADKDRVLQRFQRLDSSRSSPGVGLGLSLVHAVAQAHGGALLLSDNAPSGLTVTLRLPLPELGSDRKGDSLTNSE